MVKTEHRRSNHSIYIEARKHMWLGIQYVQLYLMQENKLSIHIYIILFYLEVVWILELKFSLYHIESLDANYKD